MANEVQILQLGDEEFKVVDAEAPRKSEIGNAEIIIKQCGVEKGRFTVNANEPVEIDLDSGYSTPIPDTDLSETAQESISKTSAIVKNGSGDLEHYAFQTSNRFGKTTLDSTSLEVEGTSDVKSKYSTSYIMKTVGDTDYRMDFPNASGTFALTDDISGKQDKLTAGSNITISGTTISATDTNTWRPLGTGANDACAGNDSRLSDSRPANGGTSSACSGNSATATTATYLAKTGDTSKPMIFRWNGQGGQPTWLWGGTDGTNMYVYNPSNFNVNYASTAGSAPANGGNSYTCNGFYMKRIACGGQRYLRILPKADYGSYTRYAFFLFGCAGGGLQLGACSLQTNNGSWAGNLINATGSSLAYKYAASKYIDIDIAGHGVYDSMQVIGYCDFDLAMHN